MSEDFTIYIVRHGQDEDNAEGLLNGRRDRALTDLGIKQATDLAHKMKNLNLKIDKVYSSPLQRASKTAAILSEICNYPTPQKDDGLIERDFGIMTGKPIRDIDKLQKKKTFKPKNVPIRYFLEVDGCETFPRLILRAKQALSKIITENKDNKNILIVAHGDIGKMLYAAYYNLNWKKVLAQFHFGNSDLIVMSQNSPAEEAHIILNKQHNL